MTDDYRFGRFELALDSREVAADGMPLQLTYRQFEALRILVEARGAVVDRDRLQRQIWPGISVDETSLNKCVSELRRALAETDPETVYVETVRGRGYRLAVPVERSGSAELVPEQVVSVRRGFWTAKRAALALVVALIPLGAASWDAWQSYSARSQAEALLEEGFRLYQTRDYPLAFQTLRRAVALDPNNGHVYSRLAHVVHKMKDPTADDRQAIEMAQKAVDVAPACGPCHATLGFFLFYHGWEWDRARTHYEEALRLAPDAAGLRNSYALLLAAIGRTGDALEQAEISVEALPLAAGNHAVYAQVLYVNGDYDGAITAANKVIGLDRSRKEAWEYRARAQFKQGLLEDGVHSMIAERYNEFAVEVGAAVDQGGGEAGLRKLLELTSGWPTESVYSWRRAAWFAVLGEHEAALAALGEGARVRNINMMLVAVDPLYEGLRPHPGFHAVLDAMDLSEVLEQGPLEVTAR